MATTAPVKGLDFTDDPFRDYRYEDPFNICFDDEPAEAAKPSAPAPSVDKVGSAFGDAKFDPFGLNSGRQSVPLPSLDPFVSANGRKSVPLKKASMFSDDEQLAWAAKESLKLEEARKQRELQEQADLELAIVLSKSENQKT